MAILTLHMLAGSAGGALSLAGVGLLWRAWRRPARSWPRLALAWGTILAALPLWAAGFGADRGTALGLLIVPAAALVLIGLTSRRRPPGRAARAAASPPEADGPSGWAVRLGRVGRVLICGPLGAAAAIALGLAYAAHGPGTEAERLVGAVLLVPLAWGAALCWGAASRHKLRTALVLTAITTGAGVLARLPLQG